jgi:Amidohydrolase family
LYDEKNRLDRTTALRLYTEGSSWFSGDEGKKGGIAVGQFADLAVLSADYFVVPEEEIKGIEAVLTLMGGKIVHGSGDFAPLAPPVPPVSPDWSPVAGYGGYHRGSAAADSVIHKGCACRSRRPVWSPKEARFWGIGCDCFAF